MSLAAIPVGISVNLADDKVIGSNRSLAADWDGDNRNLAVGDIGSERSLAVCDAGSARSLAASGAGPSLNLVASEFDIAQEISST